MKEKVVLFIGDTIVCAEPFKEFIELEGDYKCLYNTNTKEAKHNIYIDHGVYKKIPRENRPDLIIIDVYPLKMENVSPPLAERCYVTHNLMQLIYLQSLDLQATHLQKSPEEVF